MQLTIEQISACLDIPVPSCSNIYVTGVSIDSRSLTPGQMFVCIPGEHADGHDFAKTAIDKGASTILASRPLPFDNIPVLVVEDTVSALGKLAAFWRSLCASRVICITGTAGKTTLKNLLAEILSTMGKTAATRGNHNNQLGMPLTILDTSGDEKFWILEAGISHAGDMEYLGSIARPDVAVILNIGAAHTEGLGKEGVGWHKTRLLNYLAPSGRAIINADYPDLVSQCQKFSSDIVYFGRSGNPRASFFMKAGQKPGEYRVQGPNNEISLFAPDSAFFETENILAAATVAITQGAGESEINIGLGNAVHAEHRFCRSECNGYYLIDDTYNANPLSMQKMLDAANRYACQLRLPLIAVLGHMGELGTEAERWHYWLGEYLAQLKPLAVFWKGDHFSQLQSGFNQSMSGEYEGAGCLRLSGPKEFINSWKSLSSCLKIGKCVLFFKGSRSNRMEVFLEEFKKQHVTGEGRANVL